MQTTLACAARAAAASSTPTLASRSLPLLSSVLVAGARSMVQRQRASIQAPAFLSAISTASLITTTRALKPTGVVTAAPSRSFLHAPGTPTVAACKQFDTVLPSGPKSRVTRQAKNQAWRKEVWPRFFDTRSIPTEGLRESAATIGTGARDFHSARHVDGNELMAIDAGMTVFQARINRTLEQIANLPDLIMALLLDGQNQFPPGASLPRGVKLEKEFFDWLVKYLLNKCFLGPDVSFVRNSLVHSPHLGKLGTGYIDGLFRIKTTATSSHAPHGLYTTHAVLELKRDPRDLVAATVQGVTYLLSDTILKEMLAKRKDGHGEPYAALLAIAGPDVVVLMFALEDLLRLREAIDAGVTCTPRVQALLLTESGMKTVGDPFQPTLKLNQPGGLWQMADLWKRIRERSIVLPDYERLAEAGAEVGGLDRVALSALDTDAGFRHGTQASWA
ncbi:hypothetical protein AMAG_08155 [Allomyces macrogynus ATCC 38327]|uniref:Uncharacterized protein n=1 Tax=Allomyces macrogynus (strain ATCC 38327) TaxID=578462 RepID=A0A0L0SKS7_ALLM3|nr:hypothetical protein AMAG_08155 [Allomyces macrogynus ATCC 38327]|eukprot:KNE62984.1 hypothetical protein AMAG_08155 [Allomyces macrogynus ATCC 38327]